MAVAPELSDRIAQWRIAYFAVRQEIDHPEQREMLAAMTMEEGMARLNSYVNLAHEVMEHERAAADVAARLVYGVRPPEPADG